MELIDTIEQQEQFVIDYVVETWKQTAIGVSEPEFTDNIFKTNVIKKTTITPDGEEIHYTYNFSLGSQIISYHQTTLYKEIIVENPDLDLAACTEIVPITKNWIEITDQVLNTKTRYNLIKKAKCNMSKDINYEKAEPFDLPF